MTEKKQEKQPLLRRVFKIAAIMSGMDNMRQLARPMAKIISNNLEQSLQLQQALWARTSEALQSSHESGLHQLQRFVDMNTRLNEKMREQVKRMGDPGTP
ncbi:MAG: hypothetical protein H6727_17860 [Myxococcales bacterium]|nr:hypothetical protein [Myxococcales bacterium]